MGDDDEAGVGRAGHFVEQIAETLDVVIVEGGVYLVQHADRRRIGQEHGKDEGKGGERLLATRKKRKGCRFLPGRFRDDLKARFQRIVAFDEMQFRAAPSKERCEQALEMLVHHLERSEQPLAGFAVEALDAMAEPLDRLGEIIALGGERVMLGLHLSQLFLRAQIDRPDSFPVAA